MTLTNSDFDPNKNEYFFDRDPESFLAILNFYRTGELHAPTGVCGNLFYEELNFWGIGETCIQPCCWTTYSNQRNCDEILNKIVDGIQENAIDDYDEPEDYSEQFDTIPYSHYNHSDGNINFPRTRPKPNSFSRLAHFLFKKARPAIWRFLDDRNSSTGAKIFFGISVVFLVTSLLNFVLETHPRFRIPQQISMNKTLSRKYRDDYTIPLPILIKIELGCNIFFAIEFTLKFLSSPNKRKFVRTPYTFLEFLAILPLFWPAATDLSKRQSWGVIIHSYIEV